MLRQKEVQPDNLIRKESSNKKEEKSLKRFEILLKIRKTLPITIFSTTILFVALTTIISLEKVKLPSWHETGHNLSSFTNTKVPFDDCLSKVGNVRNIQLYSQNDEDGALLQTLRCLGGHGTKEYFEFGSESGMEVNTRILRDLYGWHGHLLDGSNQNADINLHQEFITPQNIVSLLKKYDVSLNLDVLSVDTDYDDFYILREILLAGYRPRVFISEYNVNFGSEWSVSVPAKPVGKEDEVTWNQKDCYFGASAMALIHLANAFEYTPVYSNNVNLIFVSSEKAQDFGMIIPSIQNFPSPQAMVLHRNCPNKTWKKIDEKTVQMKARDKSVSHVNFANSFKTIKLDVKEYPDFKHQKNGWRIFNEVNL